MKFKTVKYNPTEVLETIHKTSSKEQSAASEFKKSLQDENVIYFFYNDAECKYIGETSTNLWNRCFKNTPAEKDQPWFKESNRIEIIILDKSINSIGRQHLESSFIITYLHAGHKLHNKKS